MMQQEIMMRTTVLTSDSGIPALNLSSVPRPITAFRRDHQANAANPFWVCHKRQIHTAKTDDRKSSHNIDWNFVLQPHQVTCP